MRVNSAHHQAVASPGARATVNARAPDGVVEGIEDPGHPFALGVQWHPEADEESRVIAALVSASQEYREQRGATLAARS